MECKETKVTAKYVIKRSEAPVDSFFLSISRLVIAEDFSLVLCQLFLFHIQNHHFSTFSLLVTINKVNFHSLWLYFFFLSNRQCSWLQWFFLISITKATHSIHINDAGVIPKQLDSIESPVLWAQQKLRELLVSPKKRQSIANNLWAILVAVKVSMFFLSNKKNDVHHVFQRFIEMTDRKNQKFSIQTFAILEKVFFR